MCGRYTATSGRRDEIGDRLAVALDEPAYELLHERVNVSPREQIAVVGRDSDGHRYARSARWGLLPRWARTSRDRFQPINARDDRLAGSRLWQPLLERPSRRVLIPADGFYEWLHAEASGARAPRPAPFRHLVDGGAWFAFAGLLNTTRVDDLDEPITTAVIITTDANGPARRLHDRMPAILAGPEEEAAWLSDDLSVDDALALLTPLADDRLTLVPVSVKVNNPRNKGLELLTPDAPDR
jgi:putative SOS response-associated peptidase YedK